MRWVSFAAAMTAIVLIGSMAAAPLALAKRVQSANHTLVALGDSITFGYNLGNNKAPSKSAFPYLIGAKEKLDVVDLGVPGATSSDLLASLSTIPFQNALKEATVVTLDIGSNDLLRYAGDLIAEALKGQKVVLSNTDKANFRTAMALFQQNLPAAIAAIRKQTSAPIVLYTIYDPFAPATSLYPVTDPIIQAMNQIIETTAAQTKCLLANAYLGFNQHQNEYVLPLDVHPSIAGQAELAALGEQALAKAQAGHPPSGGGAPPVSAPPAMGLTLNGMVINDTSEHLRMWDGENTLYSSVAAFAAAYGVGYRVDSAANTLWIDGQKAAGVPQTVGGVLTAPTVAMANALAAAFGGDRVDAQWVSATHTENITLMPNGYVRLGTLVKGSGQEWIDANQDPYGPIYGTYRGQLVFAAMAGRLGLQTNLPLPKIDHVVYDELPGSRPTFLFPQASEYYYFISRAMAATIK